MEQRLVEQQPILRVSSADFVRGFGRLTKSQRGPVFVTHHGNDTHVLMDISEYRQLTSAPLVTIADPLPSVREFIGWLDYGIVVIDDDLRVLLMNETSLALLRRRDILPDGMPLFDAYPQLCETIVESYIRRAILLRERDTVDFPSIMRPGLWTRLTLLPSPTGSTTLMFRDIAEDVQTHRLADIKVAILETMTRHGGIGYARIDTRGRISMIDEPLIALTGLPEDRLKRCPVADLVPLPRRAQFRDTVDQVMTNGGSTRFETAVMTNTGDVVEIEGGVAQLRGLYGVEGVVIVGTLRN